jgi:hypothetical protein
MRKTTSLTLTGNRTTAVLRKGDYRVQKGQCAPAMRCFVRFKLANASAGALALDAAARRAFLEGFDVSLRYGASKANAPYSNTTWERLRRLAKWAGLSEMEGFDSTAANKGLAQNIAAGATVDVEIALRVPTGLLARVGKQRRLFGVGPTQASQMEGTFRQNTPSLPAGLALTGNVTIDVRPDEEPCKYDRWVILAIWHESNEPNRVAVTPPGLPLLTVERSAVHAASVLSNVACDIDGLSLYDNVSVQEVQSQRQDEPGAELGMGRLDDLETVLYEVAADSELSDLPTGAVRVEQMTHTLPTMQLGHFYIPVQDEAALAQDARAIAQAKRRTITLTPLTSLLGYDAPKNVTPFMPMGVLDSEDREVEQYPGLRADNSESLTARTHVPRMAAAAVAERIRAREAAGEYLAARDELLQLAKHVPGSVVGTRGPGKSAGKALEDVKTAVKAF